MESVLFYFAYGSNMSSLRLQQRVPSAESLGCYQVGGHQLTFNKLGVDGSAKCTIEAHTDPSHKVYGVLFTLDRAHLGHLDEAEGLGEEYHHKHIVVANLDGHEVEALTYCATQIEKDIVPFSWYHEHVLRGAIQHQLPEWYIEQFITSVESQADPDLHRHLKETAIHFLK